ncbi:group II intron maturase-specific domain-containing protein [Streptomyces sp. NPDC001276]|uniref:group II intron maturase-specific domain-containing protein n=1 Tax=unclassified Streptomyces TaxID=2593676 RepID=UPI00368693A5
MESVVEPVVAEVLRKVNPVLRGWVAYFRCGASKRTFTTPSDRLPHTQNPRSGRHCALDKPGPHGCPYSALKRASPVAFARWPAHVHHFTSRATGH